MSIPGCLLNTRRFALLGIAVLLGFGVAQAQLASTAFQNLPGVSGSFFDSPSYSSSSDLPFADPGPAEPALASEGGQYDSKSGGGGRQYAWVGGAGFNAPIGNDGPYITWGGNFTAGGGLHFSRGFSVLGEFSFFDNKLPGAFVAAGGGQGGNTKIIALTFDPTIDLFPKRTNSAYLVGGGGYYHKSTNFTVQQCCDFYGYPVNVNVSSFSSNQAGFNFGFGLTHRLGGVYGDGQMKLFGEARYTWIGTPKIGETNGLGRTELIPVTFGVRW